MARSDDDFDDIDERDDDETEDEDDAEEEAVDAIELLKTDHEEVQQLFDDYESLVENEAAASERLALATDICNALEVHAAIEEEILYPAARDAIGDDRLVDEAEVEHAVAKQLIAESRAMKASQPLFDAKVSVLGEYVRHHIEEEEGALLPALADADADLDDLGAQLAARKAELTVELQAG